jgi:hypothetical protein
MCMVNIVGKYSQRGSEELGGGELGKNGASLKISGKVSRESTPTLRDPSLHRHIPTL